MTIIIKLDLIALNIILMLFFCYWIIKTQYKYTNHGMK